MVYITVIWGKINTEYFSRNQIIYYLTEDLFNSGLRYIRKQKCFEKIKVIELLGSVKVESLSSTSSLLFLSIWETIFHIFKWVLVSAL